MSNINDLDDLIADKIQDLEVDQLRRGQLSVAEREKVLDRLLGPKSQPGKGEAFVLGDLAAGVTSKSIWFDFRRVQYAAVLSFAIGEHRNKENVSYSIDINCTVRRSFRITVPRLTDTDNFLVAVSQFTSLNIVPTVEDEQRTQQRADEEAAMNDANLERRQRRLEKLAGRQHALLETLIQVECAPRVSFGVIY